MRLGRYIFSPVHNSCCNYTICMATVVMVMPITCVVFFNDVHDLAKGEVDLVGVLALVVAKHTVLF